MSPDKRKEYNKKYVSSVKGKAARKRGNEKHRRKNREYCALKSREWRRDNPERYRIQKREQARRSRETSIDFRLKENIRSRLYGFLTRKGNRKVGSSIRALGCSLIELRRYIEERFLPGMTWGNYGEWHLDHKIPLSKFNLQDKVQFQMACHFTNLQPLWGEQNISKGNKSPLHVLAFQPRLNSFHWKDGGSL